MNKKLSLLIKLLPIAFAIFILSSCNKNSDELGTLSSQQEHLQKMQQLCSQYGWTRVEGVTQKEFEEFLLSVDYKKAEDFFKLMDTGGETINLTDMSQSSQPEMTRAAGFRLRYYLDGQHRSYFASSITRMTVSYNEEELDVIDTEVQSSPACVWTPNPTSTFYFSNNRCDIVVTGRVRWGHIKRNMTMKAYMRLRPNSHIVEEGKITSFRG